MSKRKNILSNMPTNYLNEFIIKNNCNCNDEINNYIRLIPKEFDDMYLELYKHLLYNISIARYTSSKETLMELIQSIDKILVEFTKEENVYSQYGDNKIFYACIPYYSDFNEISTIRISSGIDFSKLIKITKETDNIMIYSICENLTEIISNYLVK